MCLTVLLVNSLLLFSGCSNDGHANRGHIASALNRLTEASQAVEAIKIATDRAGQPVGENGPSRIVWRESVHAPWKGSHFAEIRFKESPRFHDDEFGGTFVREVQSPSLQAGVCWPSGAESDSDFELRAVYGPLPIKANIGFPRWRVFGLFGHNFSCSDWWGLMPETAESDRMSKVEPNQLLTRVVSKSQDAGRFFSFPVDTGNTGEHKFFAEETKRAEKVHSVFTDGNLGHTYIIWCQKGSSGDGSTRISHCRVRSFGHEDAIEAAWTQETEWISVACDVGSIQSVGSLRFKVSELVVPSHKPSVGWIHISLP